MNARKHAGAIEMNESATPMLLAEDAPASVPPEQEHEPQPPVGYAVSSVHRAASLMVSDCVRAEGDHVRPCCCGPNGACNKFTLVSWGLVVLQMAVLVLILTAYVGSLSAAAFPPPTDYPSANASCAPVCFIRSAADALPFECFYETACRPGSAPTSTAPFDGWGWYSARVGPLPSAGYYPDCATATVCYTCKKGKCSTAQATEVHRFDNGGLPLAFTSFLMLFVVACAVTQEHMDAATTLHILRQRFEQWRVDNNWERISPRHRMSRRVAHLCACFPHYLRIELIAPIALVATITGGFANDTCFDIVLNTTITCIILDLNNQLFEWLATTKERSEIEDRLAPVLPYSSEVAIRREQDLTRAAYVGVVLAAHQSITWGLLPVTSFYWLFPMAFCTRAVCLLTRMVGECLSRLRRKEAAVSRSDVGSVVWTVARIACINLFGWYILLDAFAFPIGLWMNPGLYLLYVHTPGLEKLYGTNAFTQLHLFPATRATLGLSQT